MKTRLSRSDAVPPAIFSPGIALLNRLTYPKKFFLIGLLFFLGSMTWMLHLARFGGIAAVIGWLALCAVLAVYFALFGLLASRFDRQPLSRKNL